MIVEIESTITIPDEILNALNLKTGDYLDVTVENGVIILKPVVIVPRSESRKD